MMIRIALMVAFSFFLYTICTMESYEKVKGDLACSQHPGMVYSQRDRICVAGVKP